MKKVVAAAAAFLAAVAPCSMFFASIEPVRASATDVTLTPVQTRALFGDTLEGMYTPTNATSVSNAQTFSFTFLDYGKIIEAYRPQDLDFTVDNSNILIYRSEDVSIKQGFFNPATGDPFQVRLDPVVSLSGLSFFQMSCGYSCYNPPALDSPWKLSCNKFSLWTDYNNGSSFHWLDIPIKSFVSYNYLPSRVMVGPNTYTNQSGDLVTFDSNIYQISLNNASTFFSVDMSHSDTYSYQGGAFVNGWLTKSNTGDSDFDNYYYFYIQCPTLSDGYIDNNAPPESSGGGSESSGGGFESSGGGSDSGCGCSGTLLDILNRLDLIVAENKLIDSHIVQGNSKLDEVNSNLNRIDSHIQALQIPDLMSQSSGDMSHIAQNESKNNSDLHAADANQQIINSVAGYGDVSLPNLDNVHSMPDDFSELWNYTDQDGLSWVNPILYAMPILTLTVGALAYIVFGRAR